MSKNFKDIIVSVEMTQRNNLNAFLITNNENLGYLTNFWGSFGYLLITTKTKKLFTDSRYIEEAKEIVNSDVKVFDYELLEKSVKNKIIGFEASEVTISQLKKWKKAFKTTKFKPTENVVEKLRISKDEVELKKIKKAAQINDKILSEIKDFAKIGITEKELQWKIRERAYQLGADKMAFKTIVNFNKHTAHPHHDSDETKLKKGDLILIDMGVKSQKYCSDITRVFFTKPPTKKQKEVYETLLNAQNQAIQKIDKTPDCQEIDKAARDYISRNGFGDFFGHGLGHGVGLEIHESPSLSPLSKDKLEENTVFTIEPGIYLPNKFGIRLEDLFVYKQKKAVQLSKYSKRIDDVVLNI